MGMGVDIQSIKTVIHVEPPHAVREYFQETWQAGRDSNLAHAVLYYNNHDIPWLKKKRKVFKQRLRDTQNGHISMYANSLFS